MFVLIMFIATLWYNITVTGLYFIENSITCLTNEITIYVNNIPRGNILVNYFEERISLKYDLNVCVGGVSFRPSTFSTDVFKRPL